MSDSGLRAYGIRPQTLVREPATDRDGHVICAECGRVVETSLGTQQIAHPSIDGDLETDELLTHGYLCGSHPRAVVMPVSPSAIDADGWVAVPVVHADERVREIPVPEREVSDRV